MRRLSDSILTLLKVVALLAGLAALVGLFTLNVGLIGMGALTGVACGMVYVSQMHMQATSLRRASPGTCRTCGYTHGMTSTGARCPECGQVQ